MEELVKGTVEILPVEISDRLGHLTSLDGYAVTFKITDEDDTDEIGWGSCSNEDMTALPLINTSTLARATHRLYIRVDLTPEVPILGPFEFQVV